MITSEDDLKNIGKLLNISYKNIKSELAKSYVVDGTFVVLKNIDREQQELKTELLKIPSVKVVDYDIPESQDLQIYSYTLSPLHHYLLL